MQWFKSITTHDYMKGVTSDGWAPFEGRLWQRKYYDHIIRNDRDLDRIRTYIDAKPSRWASDDENPKRIRDVLWVDTEVDPYEIRACLDQTRRRQDHRRY